MTDNERKRIMDEECKVAKSVDLVYLAKQFGFSPFRSGNLHRMKEDESLVIFNTNTFCHFYHKGEKGYGGSSIDFCMTYGNMTMPEAIDYLLNIANYKRETVAINNNYQPKSKKIEKLVLPEPNDNYKRVFAYLSTTRGINADVITELMHEKRLYESKDKHNCVFVTYDDNGEPKYASLRGTLTFGANTTFRGDVIGSDKNLGFPYKSKEGYSDTVLVFEAPIDLMSFMSLYPEDTNHYVALGCLSLNALDKFLEENPAVKNIGFILDNDNHAPAVVTSAKIKYSADGYNIIDHKINQLIREAKVKDVNEYLVLSKEQAKLTHQPKPIKL